MNLRKSADVQILFSMLKLAAPARRVVELRQQWQMIHPCSGRQPGSRALLFHPEPTVPNQDETVGTALVMRSFVLHQLGSYGLTAWEYVPMPDIVWRDGDGVASYRHRQVVVDMPPPSRVVKQLSVGEGSGAEDSGVAFGARTTIGSRGRDAARCAAALFSSKSR